MVQQDRSGRRMKNEDAWTEQRAQDKQDPVPRLAPTQRIQGTALIAPVEDHRRSSRYCGARTETAMGTLRSADRVRCSH